MTSGGGLTWRGFQRRQHAVARQVLGEYFDVPARFRLVSSSTNFIYFVRSPRGGRLVLRLAFPGWRTVDDAALEVAWLDALARDTILNVPQVVRSLSGERVVKCVDPFTGASRHTVMTTWLPGMLLGKRLTVSNLHKMGELFARLHLHAAGWTPPGGLTRKVFDGFLSRGEPEVLFAEDRLVGSDPADVEVLLRTAARVQAAYAGLDPVDVRIIHCDLWHDNIRLYRGELAPFDFEDAVLGYRLHDVAMALLDLAEYTGPDDYHDRLLPAFRKGYEQFLPWPEGDLVALQMGRVLWRLNWIARRQLERFPESVRFYVGLMRRCENTGRLTAPLRPI